jgi:hypothetical protein
MQLSQFAPQRVAPDSAVSRGVSPTLRDWRDALCDQLVDDVCAAREQEADAGTQQRRMIELCRAFEIKYRRLDGRELLAAREAEIEHERIDRLVDLLRETAPATAVAA